MKNIKFNYNFTNLSGKKISEPNTIIFDNGVTIKTDKGREFNKRLLNILLNK